MDPHQLPSPNPHTNARHRQETLLYITLPSLGALMLLIAVLILSAAPGAATSSIGADISLIFLIIISFCFFFFFGVILLAMLYGVSKLYNVLPSYTRIIQDVFVLIQYKTQLISDKSASPFIIISSWKAGSKETLHQVRVFFSSHPDK